MKAVYLLLASVVILFSIAAYSIPFKKGERIIFFGDSITELGNKPGGYVTIIRDSLCAKYKDLGIEVIGAGISGHKVKDLWGRLDRDVISKNPSIVVIYIGINDVWHWDLGIGGTTKENYETTLKEIIGEIKNKGAQVILCTPSVVGERSDSLNKIDRMLNEYSDLSRKVASETSAILCDLRAQFLEYEQLHNPKQLHEGILTYDAVHLNAEGNRFVAAQILNVLDK